MRFLINMYMRNYIQLDLFDDGVADLHVVLKSMKHKSVKYYKNCESNNCKEQILNKPHKHYCWLHLIDKTMTLTPLFPLQSQPIEIHS